MDGVATDVSLLDDDIAPSVEGDGQDPEHSLSFIPPMGILGSVTVGIQFNCDEFRSFFTSIVFPKEELGGLEEACNSFLHYAGLELHGVKVDWRTVGLSIPMNTISSIVRMNARRKLYRMKVRMDGELLEPLDPDQLERPRKVWKKVYSMEKTEKKHNDSTNQEADPVDPFDSS
ncbi:hypothetical protein R1sor_010379 [Riccia sorocarpa]|uniref:Uncharacterized protein n=1 Tax=Riccia sorocarpa TaxID=122646 RepID=A0ABD3HXU4_9MARC